MTEVRPLDEPVLHHAQRHAARSAVLIMIGILLQVDLI